MTWTAISTGSLAVDKKVTSPMMIALRDNPIAIANGDAGAPKVTSGGLNLGITSISGTLAAAASTTITLNALSFFPSVWSNGATYTMGTTAGGAAVLSAPQIKISNISGATVSYDLKWYYIG
jgi:hypothetical protein